MDADAIVIGAGAAGLAAARSLARRCLRVVVLEARDRVGGRVWPHPTAGRIAPAELGAEFIHGRAARTRELLREAGTGAIEISGEGWRCGDDGALQREDRDLSSFARIVEAAHDLVDDESVDRFLRPWEADERTRASAAAARAFVEGFDAADPVLASARAIADEWRSGVDFAIARPLRSYRSMFQHLRDAAVGAGVQICLSTVVRAIAWRPGAVAVEATCPGRPWTMHARVAIITLPVGVLRERDDASAVTFEPGLPPAKLEALHRIEMGHVVKVVLWFRSAFWERAQNGRHRDAAFFRCERQPFPTYWTQLPERTTNIVAWAGGPKAISLDGIENDARVSRALEGFGALLDLPEVAWQEFEGGLTHDWDRDPFARGAYSYVAVGRADPRAGLAAPVDETLFFAGEATSTDGQSGTVNGALDTGERAAAEAAKALGAGAQKL